MTKELTDTDYRTLVELIDSYYEVKAENSYYTNLSADEFSNAPNSIIVALNTLAWYTRNLMFLVENRIKDVLYGDSVDAS